jgi:hypothetical protein
MMNLPPVFTTLKASSAVTDIIGTNPTRCYLFGTAPQNTPEPYVVWSLPSSTPENHLDKLPVVDFDRVQLDVYAVNPLDCLNLCAAIRDALEPLGHMVLKLDMGKEEPENLCRWILQFNFWTAR